MGKIWISQIGLIVYVTCRTIVTATADLVDYTLVCGISHNILISSIQSDSLTSHGIYIGFTSFLLTDTRIHNFPHKSFRSSFSHYRCIVVNLLLFESSQVGFRLILR